MCLFVQLNTHFFFNQLKIVHAKQVIFKGFFNIFYSILVVTFHLFKSKDIGGLHVVLHSSCYKTELQQQYFFFYFFGKKFAQNSAFAI